jgi:hypothetical protein
MDINGKNFSLRRSGYASSSLVNHKLDMLMLNMCRLGKLGTLGMLGGFMLGGFMSGGLGMFGMFPSGGYALGKEGPVDPL